MKKFMQIGIAAALALSASAPVLASDTPSGATETSEARPAATFEDMQWLIGAWEGVGIGGNPAGEAFSYAGDGQMVGHFWQLDADGGVEFYELITITKDGDSLMMRLKHFTHDLTGWEAKEGDAALDFPLRSRSDDVWVFGPVTFTQDGPDKLAVSVKVRGDDGAVGSLDFSYDRIR